MSAIARTAVEPHGSLSKVGVVLLGLAAFDLTLEAALILPALPALADHYDASLVAIAWLVTGFLLASAIAVPLLGRMGDMFGKRLMILVSLGAFATGSLVCALTDRVSVAIIGRVIQGLGTATGPLAYALARDTVAPNRLSRVIGVLVGAGAAGGAIGSLLSGLLVDHASAPAIFWLLFGLPCALSVAILAVVRESPVRAKVAIDGGGAVLLGSGLILLLLAISKGNAWGWSSAWIVGLLAASAVLLAGLAGVERRVRQPLVDLGLLVARPLADANLCAVIFGYSFFLSVLLVPQLAASPTSSGYGLGFSTMGIGLLLVPTGIAALIGAWAAGRVVDFLGPRALVAAGSVLGIVAYFSLSVAHSTVMALAAGSAVLGLAHGLIPTGIYTVVVRNAVADKTAIAVAVNAVGRIAAVAIGAQIAFAIVSGAGLAGPFPAESGYSRAFLMGAVGAGLALLASGLLPRRAAPRH